MERRRRRRLGYHRRFPVGIEPGPVIEADESGLSSRPKVESPEIRYR